MPPGTRQPLLGRCYSTQSELTLICIAISNLCGQHGSTDSGYSGANVGSLRTEIIPFVWDLQPSHVILDIGTNDLADRSVDPVAVGDAIVALATEIAELQYVHVVIIFGILPRMPPARFKRRTRVDFNSIFQQANDQLRRSSATVAKLRFWPMRGLYSDPLSFLCPDGTHLNTNGMRKYTRLVRNAIIACLSI